MAHKRSIWKNKVVFVMSNEEQKTYENEGGLHNKEEQPKEVLYPIKSN